MLSDLSCKIENAGEDAAMDCRKAYERESKSLLCQKFSNIRGCHVGFSALLVLLRPDFFRLIIRRDEPLHIIDADFSLNVFPRSLQQIFRRFQTINGLQADSGLPSQAFLAFKRFALPYVFIKICHYS